MPIRCLTFALALVASVASATGMNPASESAEPSRAPIAIALHGGAGTIRREDLTAEREAAIRGALEEAARAGHAVLGEGGPAIEAVTAAIVILEDAPEFNAGRGAVLTAEGRVEMDASIMTGHDLQAGAVASVRGIRHPILAARAVLEHSPHVMLVGRGAERFAESRGLQFMPEEWFVTEFRTEQLRRIREDAEASLAPEDRWYSTVGVVALDRDGNLAAGTSTGGTSNKQWGRVGDSPIIGAGTYADNRACAVSATGDGEYFIRWAVAHEICARVRLGDEELDAAADAVVHDVLVEAGAGGGVIAMDPGGRIAMPFNTPGMYRASIGTDGELDIRIYADPDD
ncbi:MAG: isoaspartyl peptidase/L-asparaginase [Wenzhouxiangellaceae bacterium]|nr:isoaspartyl peptidase/L-asparaginase [Wenzhouxiangellaceae bacterium]